jgi:hypothetical protein
MMVTGIMVLGRSRFLGKPRQNAAGPSKAGQR